MVKHLKKTACYVRVSTVGQNEAGQRAEIKKWLEGNLNNTQITDAGLEHLKGLTSLEELLLAATQITDAGLEHLKGMTCAQRPALEDEQSRSTTCSRRTIN